ncbi:MAG: hypothetical protein PVI30_05765 [Myxococcales bacterium]|jgi:pectate lyase
MAALSGLVLLVACSNEGDGAGDDPTTLVGTAGNAASAAGEPAPAAGESMTAAGESTTAPGASATTPGESTGTPAEDEPEAEPGEPATTPAEDEPEAEPGEPTTTPAEAELDDNGCPVPEMIGWATTGSGTTGGGDSAPVVVSDGDGLRQALDGDEARVVHFSGTIDGGSDEIEIGSNKTLLGTSQDATIVGGLSVDGDNVIVRNFTLQGKGDGGSPSDAINGSGSNIWFDHLDVLEGGDGLLDLVNGADRVTTSWCKFSYTDPDHGHRLALLFGNDSEKCEEDGGRQRHTIHHNWFGDLVRSRAPRIYFGQTHIFNNFYNSPGNNYCIGVGTWASVLIENNYFKDVSDPHRLQNEYPTHIEATGNVYDNTSGDQATGPSGIGTMPERFAGSACHAALEDPGPWTPPYAYALDAAESIPELVQRCAGPQ